MKVSSRIHNSIRNSAVSVLAQIISSIAAFGVRTVFISTLGKTYLGMSGLFNDILQILSLTELGFGNSIIFLLYEPAAKRDYAKVSTLMHLYKKIYSFVGGAVIGLGLLLVPLLECFISGVDAIPDLELIYTLYLFNTGVSYFYSYKRSILLVTQNNYIETLNQTIFQLLQYFLQIVFLFITHNYILYLVIQVICTIAANKQLSSYVDKHFSEMLTPEPEKLGDEDWSTLKKNTVGMLASKIGSVIVTSTDNLLISAFVSTIQLGLYSNYTMLVNVIKAFLSKIAEGVTGSVGNLNAESDKVKSERIFNNLQFINYCIVCFCSVSFYTIANAFIIVWIGNEYILGQEIVFFISLNMYVRLYRNVCLIYTDTYGLFWNIKWQAIFGAGINLAASLFFLRVLNWGIAGVLAGTLVSNLCTNFWWEPYAIYKYGFEMKCRRYFQQYIKHLAVTVMASFLVGGLSIIFKANNDILNLLVRLLICILGIPFIVLLFYFRTEECKYLITIMKGLMKKER